MKTIILSSDELLISDEHTYLYDKSKIWTSARTFTNLRPIFVKTSEMCSSASETTFALKFQAW